MRRPQQVSRRTPGRRVWQAAAGFALIATAALAQAPAATRAPASASKVSAPDDFDRLTSATLEGATTIDTQRAFAMWTARSALFVDALARPMRPTGLPREVVWRAPARHDIPGSTWAAGAGGGAGAPPASDQWFAGVLARITSNDKSRALVFYCQSNCRASWRAARRALRLGYGSVFWYPDGADGWEKAGHPLEDREPEPLG